MAPVRSNILLFFFFFAQSLTIVALGITAVSMNVLAPLQGPSATAWRAMTCCRMGRVVRVKRGPLHLWGGVGTHAGEVHPDLSCCVSPLS